MRYLFSIFCLKHWKGKRDYLEKQQIKLHIVVSLLCLFNYPYYEETCFNKVVISITLEKPLQGNE